jgi:Rrf2 family iron-sulfur cluster assembly transcriptional regulator
VRQRISLSYLEQLFGKLRRQALVESVRGPGGGYRLGRPTEKISIADIILAVDEPLDTTLCRGMENCQEDKRCMTHNLWATLNEKLYDYLSSVTLKDLVDEQLAKEGNVAVLADRRPAAARKTVSLGA